MIKTPSLATLLLSSALMTNGQTAGEPRNFFKHEIGLSDHQIAMISRGKAVSMVLPSSTPAEIFVFGAVFVNSTPKEFVKAAFDMDRLRRLPGYLAAKRFSDPPKLSDLEGFTLGEEDIKTLRFCRPGHCSVQLPSATIRELQKTWGSNVTPQINDAMQRMALQIVRRCEQGGRHVLGTYHDAENPYDLDAQLELLLARTNILPINLPQLKQYLLDYPSATPPNVESLFYWEKVNFGLKPVLRLNHAIAYHSVGPKGVTQVVAVKQLYASHYFRLALDLTLCIADRRSSQPGFYLINLKGSTQEGLSGLMGSVVRRIALHRVYAAQQKALMNIKASLEGKP